MSGDTDTSGDTKHLSVHFNYLHNHQKLWILHSDLCHNLDKSTRCIFLSSLSVHVTSKGPEGWGLDRVQVQILLLNCSREI